MAPTALANWLWLALLCIGNKAVDWKSERREAGHDVERRLLHTYTQVLPRV